MDGPKGSFKARPGATVELLGTLDFVIMGRLKASIFSLHPHLDEGVRGLCGVSFIRMFILFIKVEPPTFTFWVTFPTYEFGGHKYSDHRTWTLVSLLLEHLF